MFALLLKYLGLYWLRDVWMTHSLDKQRQKFIERIRQTKGQ